MPVTKTTVSLADGRRLIYFDEPRPDGVPMPDRTAVDERDLPHATTHAQIRHDPLVDEWVIVASHRQDRTFLPPADECPLDPSRDGRHTEIPAADYDVVVFDNRFPSLSMDTSAGAYDEGFFVARPGVGKCEVVCFTSDHDRSFAQLSPQRARTVIDAWADRTAELSAIDGIEHVYPFENRGEEIGVTLGHPHGQIYAYPFVPPPVRKGIEVARAYRDRTGGDLLTDLLAAERAAGTRVVAENATWTAYVPHAARWPYEVHVVPHRKVPDLPALTDAERDDLATIYLAVLQAFDGLFDAPTPYISAWVQAPTGSDRDLAHLYCKIFTIRRAPDKLKYLAGSESGMAVWVGDIAPEQAAARLRGEAAIR